jgi:hypothetical protein
MAKTESNRHLTPDERESLIQVLKARFVKNMHRHSGIDWKIVQQSWMQILISSDHFMKWRQQEGSRR